MNEKILKLVQASPFLAALHTEKSFTRAALRLQVHQTAVSHRIRALEEVLGITLCERTTRSLKFTHAGEVLCEAAHKSVNDLASALGGVLAARQAPSIRISVSPSMAMKWLVPRLASARQAGLDVTVQAQTLPVDLIAGDADVAVRFGRGPYPGLRSVKLSRPTMVALASPAYIARTGLDPRNPWAKPVDILMDHRAERDMLGFGWAVLADRDKRFRQPTDNANRFDRTDLALMAAISGLGVALGRTFLVEDDIKNGFLAPLGDPIPMDASDWLLCSYEFAATEKYKLLAKWIQGQVNETLAQGFKGPSTDS